MHTQEREAAYLAQLIQQGALSPPKFSPGQQVAVRPYGTGVRGELVPAVVAEVAPHFHRTTLPTMGYYVTYPLATEQWHCHGGWVPEHSMYGIE